MIEEIANTVFMVAFGLFVGSLFGLFTVFSERIERPEKPKLQWRKSVGESWRDYFRKLHAQADEDNKRNIQEMSTWPKSMKILLSTIAVLIVALVLLINFTQIQMSWIIFLGTSFGTAVVCVLIIRGLLKTNKT